MAPAVETMFVQTDLRLYKNALGAASARALSRGEQQLHKRNAIANAEDLIANVANLETQANVRREMSRRRRWSRL